MRHAKSLRFWITLAKFELLAFVLAACAATLIGIPLRLSGKEVDAIGLTLNLILGYVAFRDARRSTN